MQEIPRQENCIVLMQEIPRQENCIEIFNIQISNKNCFNITEQIILYNNQNMLINERFVYLNFKHKVPKMMKYILLLINGFSI